MWCALLYGRTVFLSCTSVSMDTSVSLIPAKDAPANTINEWHGVERGYKGYFIKLSWPWSIN